MTPGGSFELHACLFAGISPGTYLSEASCVATYLPASREHELSSPVAPDVAKPSDFIFIAIKLEKETTSEENHEHPREVIK